MRLDWDGEVMTSKVGRLVSKHLRTQRRLNLHTLFDCF
jgi:hypothetical protein